MFKESGFSDETIRAIVTVVSGNKEQLGYEEALHILEQLEYLGFLLAVACGNIDANHERYA